MNSGTTYNRAQIGQLLKPNSIAIVGASDKPGALSGTVLSNLRGNGFPGDIYPINPKRDRIAGLACLKSVDDLPDGVDCAVLAIPGPMVLETVEALAGRNVGAIIIYAAGFAEDGEAGLAEQRQIGRIAAKHGIVIEGPNCLGCVNYVDRIPLTFVETLARPPSSARSVAIVSQSGAMAAVLATTLLSRQVDISYTVSTGNEAASGVEDYVDWLIEDRHTTVVAMIVEQFRRPREMLAAARHMREAGKHVVLLHPGTSSAARESATTHTGAMAGDYSLMQAKVEQAGIIMAETLEELGDIAEILQRTGAVPTPSVSVLGESGAFKALTLDLAETLGLPLAVMGDQDSPELRAALPPFVPVSNPLDITAQGLSQPQIYTHVLSSLLRDDRVGTVVAGIIQSDPATCAIKFPPIMAAIEAARANKPLIFAGLDEGAAIPSERISALRSAGIPWFPSTERVFRALARLIDASKRAPGQSAATPISLPGLSGMSGIIPEYQAKVLLGSAGISFPAGQFAASASGAVSVAEALGFPVVMKAQAAALGHKSDAGGVILNLTDAEAVSAAWTRIHDNVASYNQSIRLDGVLIEKMGARGTEMIVGAKRDPEWGDVILVGFGGVTAEILQDVVLLTPEMDHATIVKALLGLKQAAILKGWRSSPRLDVAALARLVTHLASIVEGNPQIREIDLNPVVIYPEGEGVIALDALMLVDPCK